MLRFSLLTLLGVVLVAGIGSAALANPTDTWRQVVVTEAPVASVPSIPRLWQCTRCFAIFTQPRAVPSALDGCSAKRSAC